MLLFLRHSKQMELWDPLLSEQGETVSSHMLSILLTPPRSDLTQTYSSLSLSGVKWTPKVTGVLL